MKPYKNKINRIRSFALSLIFIGVVIMYIGIFFRKNEIVMLIFMFLGVLAIIASTVVYAWIGSLSTRAAQIVCPNCGKRPKCLDGSICAAIAVNHLHWILLLRGKSLMCI